MTVGDIVEELETVAPPEYQESYDNSGLLTGAKDWELTGVLLSLDCTEEIVEEAIKNQCNLIIAHHPIIFSGLKKLTGSDYVQRTVIKAIQHHIAIYACHTNMDNVSAGVNKKICEKLGINKTRILLPKSGMLRKLVTFVPLSHYETVLQALFAAGAGQIGEYNSCSFSLEGSGTFRGSENTHPFVGKAGELSREKEIRIETIYPGNLESQVLSALRLAHPYEEIAYDLYALENRYAEVGSGMWGELENALSETEFLQRVKKTFGTPVLRHTRLSGRTIKTVAVCGGSGQFLLKAAQGARVDAFVTADFKYHEFFDADGKLLLIDAGHFESEQFTPEIFYEIIKKKFSTFAIHLSKINTNPINYF